MKTFHALAVVLTLACSACANLTTIDRTTVLPKQGIAVHLDAQQRVVVANAKGWACAEPSPDAVQAVASSSGFGFGTPSKEAISLAQAISSTVGSIGLRTQSITLMRDELYRICEMYFNGAMTQEQVVQLIERSQDLSLGILAIEQLTGAVVARQVLLNTSSTGTAASSINDTQRELDKAKADEAAKQTAFTAAQASLDSQKKIVATKTAEASAAKEKAKSTQAAIDNLTPSLATAQTTLESAVKDRLDLKLEVVGLKTKIAPLESLLKKRKADAATLHGKTDAAEKAYQAAMASASKEPRPAAEQKVIDDLDAARKLATGAEASANTLVTQSDNALNKAKQDVLDAESKAKAADGAVDVAQGNVDAITAKLDSAKNDPNQIAADSSAAAQKSAIDAQTKAQKSLDEANAALEKAKTNTAAIEKLGNSAVASANASSSGSGSFSSSTDRYGVNGETVEAIAKATTDIVRTIVNKGHLEDTCALILLNLLKPDTTANISNPALPFCAEVIGAKAAAYRSSSNKAGTTLTPLNTPAAKM